MLGAFPLIIPNDPVMKMKIEEKAMSLMKKEWVLPQEDIPTKPNIYLQFPLYTM